MIRSMASRDRRRLQRDYTHAVDPPADVDVGDELFVAGKELQLKWHENELRPRA